MLIAKKSAPQRKNRLSVGEALDYSSRSGSNSFGACLNYLSALLIYTNVDGVAVLGYDDFAVFGFFF